jgi:ribosomal protein L11 methyltransferase
LASYPALDLHFLPRTADFEERLHAVLDDFSPVSVVDADEVEGWRVFFPSASARDAAEAALRSAFPSDITAIRPHDVPDDGWARRSQASLTAVRVGHIVVAPPWDVPSQHAADDVVIVIEPSTGFGTGHHASTRLCLLLLQRTPLDGCRVVDVGTGSGVLAIAARRLGARSVIGVDDDVDAIDNARVNVAANSVSGIEVRHADLAALALEPADVVVGNLTAGVIEKHAASLRRLTRPGGVLIVSGFTQEETDDVSRALGLPATAAVTEEAWTALAYRRPTTT